MVVDQEAGEDQFGVQLDVLPQSPDHDEAKDLHGIGVLQVILRAVLEVVVVRRLGVLLPAWNSRELGLAAKPDIQNPKPFFVSKLQYLYLCEIGKPYAAQT